MTMNDVNADDGTAAGGTTTKNDSKPPYSDPAAASYWADLTRECLINILSRLSLEDRWRGPMLVCKSWLAASTDSSLHLTFDLDGRFDSTLESPRWWSPEFERRIDSMLRSVVTWSDGSLSEIRARHCSDRSINLVAERCPNLQALSIQSSANVRDASMARLALNCVQLRELNISYCHEISDETLALIGQNCPNLKILKRNFLNWLDPSQHQGIVPDGYLDSCPQDGDSEAAAIGKCMPGLVHLELRFSKLTGKGIGSICQGCLELEFLDLSGCAKLTGRDIVNSTSSLKNLKQVKKPNFYIPRSLIGHSERYGHWNLYDERFQTDAFRI
ncbi:F-box protein SKIP1 [Linum perenne]